MAKEDICNPDNGDREDMPNVIILITDDHSTRETNLTQLEADKLRDRDITTFVMGITTEVNITELDGLALPPVQEYIYYFGPG